MAAEVVAAERGFVEPSTGRVLAAATISGILFGLGCPPTLLPLTAPLVWIWAVPFLVIARHARATQFAAGAILAGTLGAIGNTAGVGAALGYLAPVYAAAAGLSYALSLLLTVPLRRWLGQDSALWGLPAVAALSELILFRMELGWNSYSATQGGAVGLIQFADLTGQTGVTFWVMLINVLLYREIVRARGWQLRRIVTVFALVLGIPAAYSFFRLQQTYGAGTPLEILLVQPNAAGDAGLKAAFVLTDVAVRQSKPDLIVWPETTVPFVLAKTSPGWTVMAESVADWGTPLITGALDNARGTTRARRFFGQNTELANAAILLTPGPPAAGANQVRMAQPYHKRRLVPFIEGTPLGLDRKWLTMLGAFPDRGYTLERGTAPRVLSYRADAGQSVRFAAPICYEDLYGEDIAEFARRGAQFFTVVTNDSLFGHWETAYTHASIARLRAIETRRPVVQAATTGWSLAIDAKGVITAAAPSWQPAAVRATIRPNDSLTFYVRHPFWFPVLCVVWLAGCLLLRRKVNPTDRMKQFDKRQPTRVGS